MKKILVEKFTDISRQLPALLLGVSAALLFDKSGMIRTFMGTNNGSGNGRGAFDALYDTTP
jgi:hypothetical protein